MDAKINLAKILKDKLKGTKLWTDMFGSVTLYVVTDACDAFQVKHHNKEPWFDKDGKLYKEGVLCIYPSKSMRDWEKLTWKKDDVLVNSSGFKLFFDRWANDDYTRFFGKVNLLEDSFSYETEKYTLASKDETLDTLEIEKPEFKDGDILSNPSTALPKNHIFIFSKFNKYKDFEHHVALTASGVITIPTSHGVWCRKDSCVKYATEEEKKQLFSALEKEGKAWDAEKKQIVDLKPKCEFKPFDRCIWKIRNCEGSIWQASFVSYVDEYGATPMGMSIDEDLVNLIILPYNDQTKLLVGTTDEWKGGEG